MFIDKGFYIQSVNAAAIAGHPDHDVPYILVFQIYEPDGSPAKGSYKGPGKVISGVGGAQYVLLGDPQRSTQIPEYRLSDTPTKESEESLNQFVAGLKAALEGKRMKRTAVSQWREGFEEGKKLRR